MKTFEDLMLLIANENKLNEGKLMKVCIDVNMQHNWVTMKKVIKSNTVESVETIFSLLEIGSLSQLQQVYWTIYNKGRSYDVNEVHE